MCFFFKQKTAYEMRISDWSSDVCSSDLAGRGELTQLVADHRLGDVHRDVLAAVVHGDGVAHHLRDDRGAAAPGLDDLLLALLVEDVHLLEKVVVDEGALLQAAGHGFLPPRSEEHTSELQSLMRISYAVFCLKKQNTTFIKTINT